jgi:hypothetical protein
LPLTRRFMGWPCLLPLRGVYGVYLPLRGGNAFTITREINRFNRTIGLIEQSTQSNNRFNRIIEQSDNRVNRTIGSIDNRKIVFRCVPVELTGA